MEQMKKFKLVILILCFICLGLISGCKKNKPQNEDPITPPIVNNNKPTKMDIFKEVMQDLYNNQNYTMDVATTIKSGLIPTYLTINIAQENDLIYIDGKLKGKAFLTRQNDLLNVYSYNLLKRLWQQEKTVNLKDKVFETFIPHVEISDNSFSLKNNVWVGNCDVIDITDYLEFVFYSFTNIDHFDYQLSKYDISITNYTLKTIELGITLNTTKKTYQVKMTCKFDSIGTTYVNNPLDD